MPLAPGLFSVPNAPVPISVPIRDACGAGLATTLCGTFWYRGMKIELGELPLAYGFSPEGSSR